MGNQTGNFLSPSRVAGHKSLKLRRYGLAASVLLRKPICSGGLTPLARWFLGTNHILCAIKPLVGISLAGGLILGTAHGTVAQDMGGQPDAIPKQQETPSSPTPSSPTPSSTACPESALSRIVRHRIAAGETVESIAQQYNLLPTTLMGMNPNLRQGSAPVGTEILIPPYNGIRVTVPAGSSWRDIAKRYNVRADVLFEANGCQNAPEVVFVPGINWSPVPTAASSSSSAASSPIERYPLPEVATILLAYGWQVSPTTGKLVFHNGVNLAVEAGTPVIAAGSGTVAFAGDQAGFGKLVVVNHAQGLQTRYGPLATLSVKTGQQVQAGTQLGTVGNENYFHFEVRSNSRLGWVAQDPGAYIQELRLGRTPR